MNRSAPTTQTPRTWKEPQSLGQTAFSVIELVAAMAIAAVVAAGASTALMALQRAATLESARQQLLLALREARMLAYVSAATAELQTVADGSGLIIAHGGRYSGPRELPAGTRLSAQPPRGGVRFFASGLADNATLVLTLDDSSNADNHRVVVNQRGLIR